MPYKITAEESQRGAMINRSKAIVRYQFAPKMCPSCGCCLLYAFRSNQFCSRSCAATFNNTDRVLSESSKQKMSNAAKQRAPRKEPVGEHCKLFTCSCTTCGAKFVSRTSKRKCQKHLDTYTSNGRALYQFTFHYANYPTIFDVDQITHLIKEHGWRSTVGVKNLNGLTRDHKVSVRDAILYRYDPYYIKHPLNCEFMLHNQNIQKGTSSSLTYDELVRLVDAFVTESGLEPASIAYEATASTMNASR